MSAQIDVLQTCMDPPQPRRFVVIDSDGYHHDLTYDQVRAAMDKYESMERAIQSPPALTTCGACHADMTKQLGCAGCRADCRGMKIFSQLHAAECAHCAAGLPLAMGNHRSAKGAPIGACTANIEAYLGAVK